MKLVTILLLTASVICSTWAYPANGVPDDDAELIPGQAQPSPSYPAYPSYPTYPVVPSIPSIPTVPVYPSYPTYPTTYGYFPFGWTYNILDNFSSLFNNIGDRATSAWSRLPSFRPFIKNYWPDTKTNGTTTSTVKVVGDHKFIINETTHVQESDYGHVVYKVRTVDIKPLDEDETTEGTEEETTEGTEEERTNSPESDIDEPNTTEEIDDREPVTEEGESDVDDSIDIDGNAVESFDEANEISRNVINAYENSEMVESTEQNDDIKPIALKLDEQVETEPLSTETATDKSNEWAEFDIETINRDSDRPINTYYEIEKPDNDSGEELTVPIDLSNDIAINQMLADQGGHYDPDAEIFDIHQYEPKSNDNTKLSTADETEDSKTESFDYLPYHHQTTDQRQSIIK